MGPVQGSCYPADVNGTPIDRLGRSQRCESTTLAWYFASAAKNASAAAEVTALVNGLGGQVLQSALIADVEYQGFLVELSAEAVAGVLGGATP
jgi:hypothetical protein